MQSVALQAVLTDWKFLSWL